MKILIIGSGGREHALAEAYAKSKKVTDVIVAPGNDFMPETNKKIRTASIPSDLDYEAIIKLAKKEKVDLIDIAGDNPLAAGIVDELQFHKFRTFGPTQKAAEIEWNKLWARDFMQRYDLPSPHFQYFSDQNEAINYVKASSKKLLFIKAAGLAAGKGVIRAENKQEAIDAIHCMKQFGAASKFFLIEEGMIGEEFSLFAICDGENYIIVNAAQDHKTLLDGDKGPNTGGMGCVTPISSLTKKHLGEIKKTILDPFMKAIQKEERPYTGILYLGGMITQNGIKIVEFNSRWGDPEAEVILPGIKTDYVDIVNAVVKKQLKNLEIKIDNKVRISIAGCAKGYPADYSAAKGKIILGLRNAMKIKGIKIFGAGIKKSGKDFVVNGGRVFHLVAEGNTIDAAGERAYTAMSHISIEGNNLHYRTDIGWREVERSNK